MQQIFSDEEEEIKLRVPTEEERERIMVAIVEQAKRTYALRNRTIKPEQGKPSGMFMKETNKISKSMNKMNNVQDKDSGKTKERDVQITKPQKGEKESITNVSSTPTTVSFDIENSLTQMKVSIPLLEIMKFPEYREKL